jgi:plastocyanin
MKTKKFLSGILVISMVAISMLACKKSNNNSSGSTPTIYMKNSTFSSANIQVSTGSTVMWTNDDNKVHTVTADNGSFNSGDIQPGSNYSFTFKSVGTFAYHDSHNSSMTGVIVVASASSGGY